MKKTTKKYITYLYPGSFFPESTVKEVKSFDIPKSVPKDCYGFSFSETDYVEQNGETFTGKTRELPTTYLIGKIVPLDEIPNDDKHAILRQNIEFNSPTKKGVRTRLGNWQYLSNITKVLSPKSFRFTKPRIWVNI